MLAGLLAWRAATSGATAALAQWALGVPADAVPFVDVVPPFMAPPTAAHWALAARQQHALESLGLQTVYIWQLPERLRTLHAPPLALFVRGDPELLQRADAWAIVGSRRASPVRAAWAEARATALAAAGTLVVSGGAQGIDAAAHRGALAAGKATLAYMGTPIDRTYPASNAGLFRQMLALGGALASEHPPLSTTYKSAHALRNRLIAGHGQKLLVVEAGLPSGTLSAVAHARRSGTPVVLAPLDMAGETAGLEAILQRGWGELERPKT